MDCYIYAVEKSLDSYKFNLLQNKQVFINQLKSHSLATRTIDEGAMDENGGVSFSEYVAILSDNNDLLEKAKLEKKLAVLESERLAYHRNKGNAKGKLHEKVTEIEKNGTFIERFTRDWEYLNRIAPVDTATGLRPNPLKLDGMESDNIEILADRLSAINRNARTEDDYMKIGTLFDFRILVRSEKTWDGSTESLQNKFMVEGLDGIKYTYNNGYIAKDPKLAVMNFINALERIPDMIEKRKKDNTELEKDLPVLREIVSTLWPKEGEIKELTEELATLNRRIQLTLKQPEQHGNDDMAGQEKVRPVSGSDIAPDQSQQARHVPVHENYNAGKRKPRKNIVMFPTAHCGKPRKLRKLHFRSLPQRAVFRKGQRHGRHPDKSDLPSVPLSETGMCHISPFPRMKVPLPACLFSCCQSNPSG